MKILRLIGCCLLLCTWVHAQSNYKPGFIVKEQGDTVKGYINYKEWEETPKFIKFKADPADKQTSKYYPKVLKSFGIDGMDRYITYQGRLSMAKNTFPDLPYTIDTASIVDTVFLQVHYQGSPLTLYVQKDFKKRLFISNSNKPPVELLYYEYYVNDGSTIRKVQTYTTELFEQARIYNRENAVESQIRNSRYDESDIQQILQIINSDNVKRRSGNFGSRIIVGLSMNNIQTAFNGDNLGFSSSSSAYLPRISAGIDLLPNKYTQKTYLRAEMIFWGTKPELITRNSGYNSRLVFKQYTASVVPQVIYNIYNKDDFKVHLGAGVGLNYSFYDKQGTNSFDYESFWTNFVFETGVTLNKKIEIFALYAPPGTFTNYINFSITNRAYGVGIHYLFGK